VLVGCKDAIALDEQVQSIGQHFANWSNYYHQTIKINGKPVNIVGPNSGGYSPVFWQLPLTMARSDKMLEEIKEQNQVVRDNLKQLVKQSNCNLKELVTYLKQFVDPLMKYTNPQTWDEQAWKNATPQAIAKELSCLGEFEFKEVMWGIK
jgi:hypothetical protein